MSFVFKPIEKSHITSTPFYANKLWEIGSTTISDLTDPNYNYVDSDISMSVYYGRFHTESWLIPDFEETTTHEQYSRTVWNSAYTLYYRDFQRKPFEYFKAGNVGVETRNITEKIQVFSIPQKVMGLGIDPGSFRLTKGSYTFIDDGNGNVIGGTSPGTHLYNENLENFFYCSYYLNESALQLKHVEEQTAVSFNIFNHGNLGATVNYNELTGSGVPGPVHSPAVIPGRVNNMLVFRNGPDNPYYVSHYNGALAPSGSSYIRVPHNKKINFSQNEDFTVAIWIDATAKLHNYDEFIMGKYGMQVTKRAPWSPSNGQFTTPSEFNNILFGGEVIEDTIFTAQYPYKLELLSGGTTVKFSRSDGATTDSVTGTAAAGWFLITAIKSGSNLELYINNTKTTSPCNCLASTQNLSDLFVGCSGDKIYNTGSVIPSQFKGDMGSFHIFNRALTASEVANLVSGRTNQWLPYNNHYGNILYDQGMIIWTNGRNQNVFNSTNCSFDSMKFRSKKLITSNEVICVSGPSEHNMTMNPSILMKKSGICNPGLGSDTGIYNDDGECYSFVTGSDFSPYVTSVGLYNDHGELLVVGKLAYPVKKAKNCDTIFVIRWDS